MYPHRPQRLCSLCAYRWSNRSLGLLTLALFTRARVFKDTRQKQCQQLYLSHHGDGMVLTVNFPGSLPDEVVGSTSLPHSVCFLSTHGSKVTQEKKREKSEEKEGKEAKRWEKCYNDAPCLKRWVTNGLRNKTTNERKGYERNENVER